MILCGTERGAEPGARHDVESSGERVVSVLNEVSKQYSRSTQIISMTLYGNDNDIIVNNSSPALDHDRAVGRARMKQPRPCQVHLTPLRNSII